MISNKGVFILNVLCIAYIIVVFLGNFEFVFVFVANDGKGSLEGGEPDETRFIKI